MSGRAAIGSATGGLDNTCTSAITTINISGKESKLTMDRGDIGSIRIAQGNPKVSIETYITVEDGVVLECKKGYIGYVGVTSGAGSEAYASSKTVIEIKDDSKFTIEGGYLGYYSGTTKKIEAITDVTVSGNGVLRLDGGHIIGAVGNEANIPSRVTITLKDEARFEVKGAARLNGCVYVSDNATMAFEEITSITDLHSVIYMSGGKLENAGAIRNTRDYPQVAIDTNSDYEKDIDVGGLPASRLLSFSIQSDGTSILNIGDGKLSLTNAKRQDGTVVLLIGDSRVKKQGVEKELTPIFQFADPQNGKVTLASGKHARLNFTGSHLTELADDGKTITIEVKLTNGTLTGWEDGQSKQWCEEHFEIGSNWDLKITGVDAEGGSQTAEKYRRQI